MIADWRRCVYVLNHGLTLIGAQISADVNHGLTQIMIAD